MEIQETPRTGRKAASSIPPAFPGATHITRVVLHPYGRSQSPSYTLSLYDTGIPLPDAHGHYYGYRLYEHFRGAPSTVLFSGSDYRGTSTGEAVLDLINRLTTRPGDTTAEHTVLYTPGQLQFLVSHAAALRTEAVRRFGWSDKLVHLRSDLEAVYSHRSLKGQGPRHRFALGVLTGQGDTRTEARRSLETALGAHASALPRFQIGGVTGVVYAQFQHGRDTVIQVVDPRSPEQPLGDSARFSAKSLADADDTVDTFVAEAERLARSERVPPPVARPAARASRMPGVPDVRPSIRVMA
jgi:hypothetical protein